MAGEWQAGLGWVCRVAPVWLGHWLGGGFGRARPEVWGLERSLSRVRQSSGHRVPRAGQGEVGVATGRNPSFWPLATEWGSGTVGPIICLPRHWAWFQAWVSQHLGGQGGAGGGQSFLLQGSDASQ